MVSLQDLISGITFLTACCGFVTSSSHMLERQELMKEVYSPLYKVLNKWGAEVSYGVNQGNEFRLCVEALQIIINNKEKFLRLAEYNAPKEYKKAYFEGIEEIGNDFSIEEQYTGIEGNQPYYIKDVIEQDSKVRQEIIDTLYNFYLGIEKRFR